MTDRAAAALPDRPPRSLLVHFGVDSAVAFLALFVLGFFFGVPWGITAVVALVIGAIACAVHPSGGGARPGRAREQAGGS